MSLPRYKEPTNNEIIDRQFLIKHQNGEVVVNDDGDELVGAVLDNDSLTKRYFGRVTLAAEAAAGIEQLLDPEIGDMVKYTGKFRQNPYKRIAVSMEPILAVVYAENPYVAGDYVRMLHNKVNGTADDGRKINALNPTSFYWAGDTFVEAAKRNRLHFTPYFNHGLKAEAVAAREQQIDEQWHLESNTWYSYYGMPMNMVPADHDAYVKWRRDIIDNRLAMNDTAEWAIDLALERKPPCPDGIPKSVWRLAELAVAPITEIVSLATIGEISPDIRAKFGIPFSKNEQKHLDELRDIAKAFIHPLPNPLRYYPQAYASQQRERGGEHRNLPDRLIHTGMQLGVTGAKATVIPLFKRAQALQLKKAA